MRQWFYDGSLFTYGQTALSLPNIKMRTFLSFVSPSVAASVSILMKSDSNPDLEDVLIFANRTHLYQ